MKILNKGYLLASSLALMASMCGGPGDATEAPHKSTLNIILIDSLTTKSDDDIERLPENIRDLCAVLISDSKNCKGTYILDPSLLRLDLKKELTLKTTIEKGGAKDVTNPKVIGKLIQKNFDELEVPSVFTRRPLPGTNAPALISEFISTKASKDSLLVFSEDGSLDTYTLNNRIYKVFTSIDDVRNKMLSILCENPKANFSLLVNPPTLIPEPTLKKNTIKANPTPVNSTKHIITRISTKKPLNTTTGDLTIIKGSEGCDVCTHYYSATDALGKSHEVREKNSTYCCPCGKTIEMKGRTYRMECNQGNNKLVLVE